MPSSYKIKSSLHELSSKVIEIYPYHRSPVLRATVILVVERLLVLFLSQFLFIRNTVIFGILCEQRVIEFTALADARLFSPLVSFYE